ncbi:MAG TPA: phosphoenolpyruvate--protein phosphotransferase, partial [Pirellulales bacterium]
MARRRDADTRNHMQRLQGIAVSPGVAIGEALVMGTEGFRIPRRFVARDAVDDETARLNTAFAASIEQVSRNRDAVSRKLGREYGAIFEAHLQMLNDVRLRAELDQLIRQRHYSPEYAVSRALRRYVKVFQSLDNSYLAERATDIIDIEKRLLRNLLGLRREEISSLTSPVLILAHNLTPSEVANLDRQFVLGFVTEEGGSGSHTAIVAQGLEIPAVVGAGSFLTDVSGGDLAIIDGDHGQVILQPDEETIARYRRDAEHNRSQELVLTALRDLPAITLDGAQIELMGNIEFPHEVRHCVSRGAGGIGLYRTEFLYLGVDTPPDEEVHFQSYSGVVEAMGTRPVVIRTFDLGADKVQAELPTDDEKNPFLGLRSIRLALRNLPIFRTQLRAILRASAKGNVRVMFPLIATMRELRQAKMVLADVMEDLEERGAAFNRKLPVGMMVEVPSA